jgi:hypothetical protein
MSLAPSLSPEDSPATIPMRAIQNDLPSSAAG